MAKPPAPRESQNIAEIQNQLPAGYDIAELQQDALSNPSLDTGDVALPYLVVLQTNSPQCNPAKTDYIPEARPGMFYNNVLDDIYEGRNTGLIIVPCAYERKYVEWVHRDAGGGWVGEHPITSDIMNRTKPDEKGKPRLPNGNVITETAYHYVLAQDPEQGAWFQAVMGWSSTFLRANRKWNNMLTTSKIPGTETQAPRYLYPYHLTTIIQSKGENSWFVPEVQKIESPNSLELYRACREFANMVNAGLVKRPVEPGTSENIDPETGEIL